MFKVQYLHISFFGFVYIVDKRITQENAWVITTPALKVYQLFMGDLSFKHSQLLKSAFPVKLTSIARLLLAILSPFWRLQTNSWWKLTPVRITEFITDDELHKFFANCSRPKQLTQMYNVTCQTSTSHLSEPILHEDWNLTVDERLIPG